MLGEKIFKYFVGYFNHPNDRITSLLIKLTKINESIKSFEKVKYMSIMFKEKYNIILNKNSETWDKVKQLIRKHFDVEVIHKNKYITTKLTPHNNKIRTDFHDKGLTTEQTLCLTYLLCQYL